MALTKFIFALPLILVALQPDSRADDLWKKTASLSQIAGCHYALARLSADKCEGDPSPRDAKKAYCDELECSRGKKVPVSLVEIKKSSKRSLCVFYRGDVFNFPVSEKEEKGVLYSGNAGRNYGLNIPGYKQSCDRDFMALRYGINGDSRTMDVSTHPRRDWALAHYGSRINYAHNKAEERKVSEKAAELASKNRDPLLLKDDAFTAMSRENRINQETSPELRQACREELIDAMEEMAESLQDHEIELQRADLSAKAADAYARRLLQDCKGVTEKLGLKLAARLLSPIESPESAPASGGARRAPSSTKH